MGLLLAVATKERRTELVGRGLFACIALVLRSSQTEGELGGLQARDFCVPTVGLGAEEWPEWQKRWRGEHCCSLSL